MTVSPGDLLRVTIEYTAPNASVANNVFHYVVSGSSDSDDAVLDAVENWIDLDWGPRWNAIAANDAELTNFDLSVMFTDGRVQRNVGGRDINLSGGGGTGVAPAGACAFMTADTVKPKQTGRKYVPFIADSNITQGILDVTTMADLTALFLEWFIVLTSTGGAVLTPGLLSRTLLAFEPFLASGSTTNIVAYQRRRKPNVGS